MAKKVNVDNPSLHAPNAPGLIAVTALLILGPAYPALAAFDIPTAGSRLITLAQYAIIIAGFIGIVRSLSKMKLLLALGVFIVAAVIFALADPAAFKAAGSGVLDFFTMHAGSGGQTPQTSIQTGPTPSGVLPPGDTASSAVPFTSVAP